ncbi:MAG: LacI family DNA-binding transcriptional regulator [Anaerolineales bacterium]
MRPQKQSVTIQHVAKAAGVSVSTVSRVLNGKVDVAEETKERIEAVIKQLGYASSLAARSMRSKKNQLIGLIMPDIAYPFAWEVMKGVNRAIAESEYDLLVYTRGDVRKYGTAAHEQQIVSLLNGSITDGLLIVAPVSEEFFSTAPIVSVDHLAVRPGYPSVHSTNYEGALEAMRHLLALGHRRIGFISGRGELLSAQRRFQAYQNALAEAGIAFDEALIARGDYTTATGHDCARQLLSLPQPPTAIFAANDQSAMGVYQAAQEMGKEIPRDLSVIGFDNIPEAAYLNLTTVDQFIAEMGYQAAKTLFRLIEGQTLETKIQQLPTRLVVRASCQAPLPTQVNAS